MEALTVSLTESLAALRGRRVLITGDTGFKGSWLAHWLQLAGADVTGLALPPHTSPSHFDLLDLRSRITHVDCDIRDASALHGHVRRIEPEVVFHLAAQALVRRSYADPVETFTTNVIGSLNVLEAVRTVTSVAALVYVTSDKCYLNKEWQRGYHENDELGGRDPYSASKAAAELAYATYCRSYFDDDTRLRVASARAGNVVGGGDWSPDRLVPDCMRGLIDSGEIVLRRPEATRPWQHVLEPLSGYVMLAGNLLAGKMRGGDSWNFGPDENNVHTVHEVATLARDTWGSGQVRIEPDTSAMHEATLLQLNCDKAHRELLWSPRFDFETTIHRSVEWYRRVHTGTPAPEATTSDIEAYMGGVG